MLTTWPGYSHWTCLLLLPVWILYTWSLLWKVNNWGSIIPVICADFGCSINNTCHRSGSGSNYSSSCRLGCCSSSEITTKGPNMINSTRWFNYHNLQLAYIVTVANGSRNLKIVERYLDFIDCTWSILLCLLNSSYHFHFVRFSLSQCCKLYSNKATFCNHLLAFTFALWSCQDWSLQNLGELKLKLSSWDIYWGFIYHLFQLVCRGWT